MDKYLFFRTQLMDWFGHNSRSLPWKKYNDPYKIWVSEVILQQTRVAQGTPYLLRFIERFPTVAALARADEAEVLKLWEGLGYYSRARNLHAAARYVADELEGRFPDSLDAIRRLKGVGEYTAAAVASFAFGLPHAAVDGNVIRILSRYFGMDAPADDAVGRRLIREYADQLLDTGRPGEFNQAMMDFGALQCVPRNPVCAACPLHSRCIAFETASVHALPVKRKKAERKERFFVYAVLRAGDQVMVRKREGDDIWKNLYEFPLKEPVGKPDELLAGKTDPLRWWFDGEPPEGLSLGSLHAGIRQQLTHQTIHAVFIEITVDPARTEALEINEKLAGSRFFPQLTLKKIYPLPRLIARYWEKKNVSLSLV